MGLLGRFVAFLIRYQLSLRYDIDLRGAEN